MKLYEGMWRKYWGRPVCDIIADSLHVYPLAWLAGALGVGIIVEKVFSPPWGWMAIAGFMGAFLGHLFWPMGERCPG